MTRIGEPPDFCLISREEHFAINDSKMPRALADFKRALTKLHAPDAGKARHETSMRRVEISLPRQPARPRPAYGAAGTKKHICRRRSAGRDT